MTYYPDSLQGSPYIEMTCKSCKNIVFGVRGNDLHVSIGASKLYFLCNNCGETTGFHVDQSKDESNESERADTERV